MSRRDQPGGVGWIEIILAGSPVAPCRAPSGSPISWAGFVVGEIVDGEIALEKLFRAAAWSRRVHRRKGRRSGHRRRQRQSSGRANREAHRRGVESVASGLVVGVQNLGADDLVGGTGANAGDDKFSSSTPTDIRSTGQPRPSGQRCQTSSSAIRSTSSPGKAPTTPSASSPSKSRLHHRRSCSSDLISNSARGHLRDRGCRRTRRPRAVVSRAPHRPRFLRGVVAEAVFDGADFADRVVAVGCRK